MAILSGILNNRQYFVPYTEEWDTLPKETDVGDAESITNNPSKPLKISPKAYCKTEKRVLKKDKTVQKLAPVTDFKLTIAVSYTSPAKRSTYYSEKIASLELLLRYMKQYSDKQASITEAQRQRRLLSPSLRYDIMRRDNFRCTICGRKESDGVKLQVDHIIPVAKGGKTEPDNLRTLCDECNLGKSDKYTPGELN